MTRLLLVVPTLDPCGPARQIALLAPALARAGFNVHVATLGGPAPLSETLTQQGVPVTALGWTHRLHLPGLWRLRQLVAGVRPDVIHAWKLPTLRALQLVLGRRRPRLLLSGPWQRSARRVHLSWLDRWLASGVDAIVASTQAEAQRCQQLGLPAQLLTVVPPGIETPAEPELPPTATGRVICCAGVLEEHKGFHEAIWAFDCLSHAKGVDRLILVGGGPDRRRLEQFAKVLHQNDRVHFAGPATDLKPFLRQARVVWVPGLVPGGLHVALEAQAAGVPVIASAWPELAEVVRHGETGFLTPPGDPIALAKQTRWLFEDTNLQARLARAGQQWVRQHFTATALVERLVELYGQRAAA